MPLFVQSVARAYRDAFAGLPRAAWLLSVVTFVHRSGTMVLPFLTLYLTGPLGYTSEHAAWMFAVFGLGSLAGTYLGGWATDRFGSQPVQAWSLVAAGAGFVVLGKLPPGPALYVGLFVVAVQVDAFRPANAVAYAELATAATRTRAFALRRLAINLGMTFGPVIGGFLALHDYFWLFVADGGTCFAAALLLVVFRRPLADGVVVVEPEPGAAPPVQRSPWTDLPYVGFLVGLGVLSAIFFQWLAAMPIELRDVYRLEENQIGFVFAVNTVLIILFEMVLIARLTRVPMLRVVAWGSLAVGAGYGLVPFGDTFLWAVLVMVVITFGEMLAFPQSEAWAAARAERGSRGKYLGLFSFGFAASLTAGPALGAWIYGRLGSWVLWIGCAVAGVLLWVAFEWMSRRDEAAQEAATQG